MKSRWFKLRIKDLEWHYRVLSESEFRADHTDDASAICVPDQNDKHLPPHHIDFKEDTLGIGVVRHELFHAYFASCCTFSTDMKQGDAEEIAAEILEHHWDRMHEQAIEMYNNLLEVADEGET